MEIVTFTNRLGESVTFSGPPFYLSYITGLGETEAAIQSQKTPYEDGINVIDVLLEERPLEVGFVILNDIGDNSYGTVSKRREQLGRVINPKLGAGTLRYENDYLVREIQAIPETVPKFPDKGERAKTIQKGSVSFVAPDPYWRSLQIDEEPAFKPLFKFPFEGAFQMGEQRDRRIINNDGDAAVPLYVEFYGPATQPRLENITTGEFIQLNKALLEGEKLVIDTTPGAKKVEFVGVDGAVTDVMPWLHINSTFFKLVQGENDINYTSQDEDVQSLIVNISYRKAYNAV